MSKNIKRAVKIFKKKYMPHEISEKAICEALRKQGYTVIYFNAILNDSDTAQIISNLNLEEYISTNKGFTFANDKFRLVFINEALTEEERLMVLAHEMGHICFEHTQSQPILGQDVKQEHEANEFAHYLLHPNKTTKTKAWVANHKKILISACVGLIVIAIGMAVMLTVSREKTFYGEYYITTTGSKYHKKDCSYVKNKTDARRMTKEEFDSGKYEPCKTCLPNN